jgi:hypothetical protein
LRFVPLQRLPDPRCAIRSGQAPDDPASAFAAVRPRHHGPAVRTDRTAMPPMRFSAWRIRCGEARCADLSFAVSHGS